VIAYDFKTAEYHTKIDAETLSVLYGRFVQKGHYSDIKK